MAELLAIIPFYKRQDQLDRCLAALAASEHPVTPWVHDNNTINLGFTKAVNLGLREALRRGCEYALLLNQDCYVRPDMVGKLVAFMSAHSDCAIAGPMQLAARDEDEIVHGGCTQAYPSGVTLVGRKSRGDCAVSRPMPWVDGAALFVRMSAVVEIGLMDQNMFLVGSDSDWCYTARARGWSVWYCAEAQCVHEIGESMTPSSPEVAAMIRKDMAYWSDKWLGSTLYARLAVQRMG